MTFMIQQLIICITYLTYYYVAFQNKHLRINTADGFVSI